VAQAVDDVAQVPARLCRVDLGKQDFGKRLTVMHPSGMEYKVGKEFTRLAGRHADSLPITVHTQSSQQANRERHRATPFDVDARQELVKETG